MWPRERRWGASGCCLFLMVFDVCFWCLEEKKGYYLFFMSFFKGILVGLNTMFYGEWLS